MTLTPLSQDDSRPNVEIFLAKKRRRGLVGPSMDYVPYLSKGLL